MSKSGWTEKREHRRSLAKIPAWVGADGARIDASTRDISIGGVQVCAKAKVEEGERVELSLEITGQPAPLALRGKVAWKREDVLGVIFEALSEEDEKCIQSMINAELGIENDPSYSTEEATQDL